MLIIPTILLAEIRDRKIICHFINNIEITNFHYLKKNYCDLSPKLIIIHDSKFSYDFPNHKGVCAG